MKYTVILIAAVLILFGCTEKVSSTSKNNFYFGPTQVIQSSDGFYVTGIGPSKEKKHKISLIKIDMNLNTDWRYEYETDELAFPTIIETSAGIVMVIAEHDGVKLNRLDAKGNVSRGKTIPGSGDSYGIIVSLKPDTRVGKIINKDNINDRIVDRVAIDADWNVVTHEKIIIGVGFHPLLDAIFSADDRIVFMSSKGGSSVELVSVNDKNGKKLWGLDLLNHSFMSMDSKLLLDSEKNVIVGSNDSVYKISPIGKILFSKKFNDISSLDHVAIMNDKSIVISGYCGDPFENKVLKLTDEGNVQWIARYRFQSGSSIVGSRIVCTADGIFIFTQVMNYDQKFTAIGIAKIDENGHLVFVKYLA